MAERPLRIAIVDDEPLARDGIRLLAAAEADVEIVAECGDGAAAVEAIVRERPDLVFLDVQMPNATGFEVLAALAGELGQALPVVVFVTAFDQYALRAFEVHAVDYLLKPYPDVRFREALGRAREAVRLARVSALSERLLALIATGQRPGEGAPAHLARLAIRSAGRVVFLQTAEIDWIEAADYYAQIHCGRHSYLHRQTMQSLAAQLDPEQFVRIHRSAIVNVARVRELRHKGRELVAVLQGGEELKVGRRHRENLRARLS